MASTEEKDVEVAHKLSAPQEEEEVVRPDLYVCLDECYIYSQCGDDNGLPHGDADILYDTIPDEIIQLDVTNRIGKYVRCQKPVAGWVFLPQEEVQYDWGILNEIYQTKKAQEEHLLVYEERRDYTQQRMMMQTVPPDQDFAEINKLMQIKALRWLTFYFRRNPFLPGLIILGIQLVIETIILFDVYSDGKLAYEVFESGQAMMFMVSASFIAAPYVIAWTAAASMNAKKLKQNRKNICQIIGCMLFNIAPLGIAFLFAVDLYHWFECVFIKPIFYLATCGKQIRTISYGELGYYKLRRVSEVFAEAIPQAVIQLVILVQMVRTNKTGEEHGCAKCTPLSVIQALISSFFVLLFWCAIIYFEGKKNGMKFVEYVTVIFQGSFNFVEMLPAIERGTPTGEKVNWTLYKFSDDGVGHVAKALNTPRCKLKLLKMSKYSIKDLDRAGCRFLGGALAQCNTSIELIISRLEEEIIALFDKYDVDHGKSLDFDEFVYLCLDIKQNMREPCLRSDVFLIYEELADSVAHEVWQLDLQVKIKGSLEFIGLLDYNLPLQHAFENSDLKMISLLMAYQYEQHSDENMAEFEHCVMAAVTAGKVREAMCLCEHKGVPIVVHLENGRVLLPMDDDGASDPYARVSIFDQQQQSSYRKQTLNPNWEEDLLFIIPFEFMERLTAHAKYLSMADTDEAKQQDMWSDAALQQAATNRGQSFAAMDLDAGTVTGMAMPSYCQDAIEEDLRQRHGKDFTFNTAQSVADLNRAHNAASDPEINKQLTTDGGVARVMSAEAAHSQASRQQGKYGKKLELTINIRVFDHDLEEDDDFMGSFKGKYKMEEDTSKFHEHLQIKKLHNNELPDLDAGTITFRVFLNVVQTYQDHQLHYIDSDHKDNDINLFRTEITDARPQNIGSAAVFSM
eukprot:29316_1